MRVMRARRSGQAMIETVLSVLVVTFVFLALFKLSHMLTGKILLEHAAMRVARARAVGFNEFMCVKAARVATIPVAGRRLWPEDPSYGQRRELANVAIYMGTPNEAVARGVLEYEGWSRLRTEPGDGTDAKTSIGFSLFGDDDPDGVAFVLEGEAGVEENFKLYMDDMGR